MHQCDDGAFAVGENGKSAHAYLQLYRKRRTSGCDPDHARREPCRAAAVKNDCPVGTHVSKQNRETWGARGGTFWLGRVRSSWRDLRLGRSQRPRTRVSAPHEPAITLGGAGLVLTRGFGSGKMAGVRACRKTQSGFRVTVSRGWFREGHDFTTCGKTRKCAGHRGRAALQGRVSRAKSTRALAPVGLSAARPTASVKMSGITRSVKMF